MWWKRLAKSIGIQYYRSMYVFLLMSQWDITVDNHSDQSRMIFASEEKEQEHSMEIVY